MAHWLMKAEPSDYSWDDLVRDGTAVWDGVHSHAAANHMRSMRLGDRIFFYRSQKEPAVIGVMELAREAYQDPDDRKSSFVLVQVKPLLPVEREVSLQAIKAEPKLQHLPLVRQSRLSVSPIDDDAWRLICSMAGIVA